MFSPVNTRQSQPASYLPSPAKKTLAEKLPVPEKPQLPKANNKDALYFVQSSLIGMSASAISGALMGFGMGSVVEPVEKASRLGMLFSGTASGYVGGALVGLVAGAAAGATAGLVTDNKIARTIVGAAAGGAVAALANGKAALTPVAIALGAIGGLAASYTTEARATFGDYQP